MFDDPIFRHTVIALVIIVGSAVIGRLLKSLLEVVFKRLGKKTEMALDDLVLGVLSKHVIPLSVIGGFSIGIQEVRKGLTPELAAYHQVLDYLSLSLFIVFVFLIVRLMSLVTKAFLERYIDELSNKTQGENMTVVSPMLMKFVNMLLIFIAALIILDHVGVNIGSLLVSLGVGSLAVALAAQETISNMIGWFVILLDQPFRVGDVIRLPSGEEGKVYQIGLRATRILNPDSNVVVIPNGDLIKSRIVNVSEPELSTRLVIDFNVTYETDIDRVRKILLELASQHAEILREPSPEVAVIHFGDMGITIRLIARVYHFNKMAVETSLRERIYDSFKRTGIEFAVPQRIIHIVNAHES